MYHKRKHIHQILTLVMLWAFSLAIVPWGALHHHEEVPVVAAEKHCTHKLHLKAQKDTCLICKAHFEKNYTLTAHTFHSYLESKLVQRTVEVPASAYTALISTSLRGPPSIS
ncbi:hypothetical protein D9M68_709830 [compost metagenome]